MVSSEAEILVCNKYFTVRTKKIPENPWVNATRLPKINPWEKLGLQDRI